MDSLLASSDGTAFSEEQSSKAVGGGGGSSPRCTQPGVVIHMGKGPGRRMKGAVLPGVNPPLLLSCRSLLAGKMTDGDFVA